MNTHLHHASLQISEFDDRTNPALIVPLTPDGSAPGIGVEVSDTPAVVAPAVAGVGPVQAATVAADPNGPSASLPTLVATTGSTPASTQVGPSPTGGLLAGLSAPVFDQTIPTAAASASTGSSVARTPVGNEVPPGGTLVSALPNPTPGNLPDPTASSAGLSAAQLAANVLPIVPQADNRFLGVLSGRGQGPAGFSPIDTNPGLDRRDPTIIPDLIFPSLLPTLSISTVGLVTSESNSTLAHASTSPVPTLALFNDLSTGIIPSSAGFNLASGEHHTNAMSSPGLLLPEMSSSHDVRESSSESPEMGGMAVLAALDSPPDFRVEDHVTNLYDGVTW
ncbi:hypothetical protein [Zavarzinella formosa]|uniref:hypothetical protein n=1 Tax=Zavarzinella formosa TaxID=360055 RepID=UPI0002F4008E|nr:hypothetical protein [Zavarzinella formosa]